MGKIEQKVINFKVLGTISKFPLMTPFIFPLVTQNNFQKKFSFSQVGCRGGAKTFGASSHCILRPCVFMRVQKALFLSSQFGYSEGLDYVPPSKLLKIGLQADEDG